VELPTYTYFRGRVAMAAMLRGLGIGAGDRVAIQAFTCIAVPEAVLAVGATPMYVDTVPDGFTMDPVGLEAALTSGARAAVIQHTFGLPADTEALLPIAARHHVPVLEDCAHTVASRVNGKTVGTLGAGAFYSFEASKPVFIGIGGAARVNDASLAGAMAASWPTFVPPTPATQVQLLALYLAGLLAYRPAAYWTVRSIYRAAVRLGVLRGNYNPVGADAGPADDFVRRMGAAQRRVLARTLRRLARQTAHRRWVAESYRRAITASDVRHPEVPVGVEPVFGRYPLLVPDRATLMAGARAAFVELADFYATPVHPLEGADLARVGYEPGSCPHAESVAQRVVSLPTATTVGSRAIARAARLLNRA
jgi:dTDP-4-amino-4,6-dideoxygalactose transaminase